MGSGELEDELPVGPSAAASAGHARAGWRAHAGVIGVGTTLCTARFVDNLTESQGQHKVRILHCDAGPFTSI